MIRRITRHQAVPAGLQSVPLFARKPGRAGLVPLSDVVLSVGYCYRPRSAPGRRARTSGTQLS